MQMRFETGSLDTAQILIYPLFKESIQDTSGLSLLRHYEVQYELLPHMAGKDTVTWFFGRRGEPHLLLVGLGEASKFHPDRIRQVAGIAGRAAEKEKRQTAGITFEAFRVISGFNEAEAVTAWVEGWILGTYSFQRYKANPQTACVSMIYFEANEGVDWSAAIMLGEIRAGGTVLSRDLSNEPPNILRPLTFADRISRHFSDSEVQVKVYEGEELQRLGMVGLLAVGRGSKHEPAFVELRYCTDPTKPLIALVGKGITFDTGGISLKHDWDISDMRMDMAGAAAVVGALDIIANRQLAVNVAVLVAAAENMPDGDALLPGELLQYPNNVSVQVGNTDSEGRLVLADALIYAHTLGAKEVVDIATLTYSCEAALGSYYAGIWGGEESVQQMRNIGEALGERVWHLPLTDAYEENLKSVYADIRNITHSGGASATTAALFLRKFVDPSMEWMHIDMAGLKEAHSENGCLAVGATGYGARLLAEWVAERTRY